MRGTTALSEKAEQLHWANLYVYHHFFCQNDSKCSSEDCQLDHHARTFWWSNEMLQVAWHIKKNGAGPTANRQNNMIDDIPDIAIINCNPKNWLMKIWSNRQFDFFWPKFHHWWLKATSFGKSLVFLCQGREKWRRTEIQTDAKQYVEYMCYNFII